MTSLTQSLWAPAKANDARIQALREETGLSETGAAILATRWPDGDLPEGWFDPSVSTLHDPFKMLNMHAAIDRLRYALKARQKIRIITDYDVDGTTSSLILQASLRLLAPDLDLDYHIPNRFHEGYGFSVIAAEQAAADRVDLIVTADIGVRDFEAVEAARRAGIDVLICDHHLPSGAAVPQDAIVLCPPQEGCTYPNGALAACGVSLKLATALLHHHAKWDVILLSMLKLGAIGTVADLVSLRTPENRAIVSLGLQRLNHPHHHAGLKALLDIAGSKPGAIRTSDLGFRIGPRINAAGRVSDAKLVVRLLNSRDPSEARELAEELNRLNDNRRQIQKRVETEAVEQVGDTPDPFIVVAKSEEDGWHRGVVGIVASRLKDEFHRPAAVVAIQGDTAVGSVRSIRSIHAIDALDSCQDLLVRYGGHPAAAGFTVHTEHLSELRRRLGTFVETHATPETLVRTRTYDAEVPLAALSLELFAELGRLGPFGMKNPTPQLLLKGIRPQSVRAIGKDKSHLKFRISRSRGPDIDALWWGRGDLVDLLSTSEVDVIGQLGENLYRGRRSLQVEIKDARIAET